MVKLYRWIKLRWYRRQAKRAIWFLRYLDRTIHSLGWGRRQVQQFWEDFRKHPEARRKALNEISVINKIAIREQGSSRLMKQLEISRAWNQKLQLELNAANAKIGVLSAPPTLTQVQPFPMPESERARLQMAGLDRDREGALLEKKI